MAQQSYTLHLDAGRSMPVELSTDEPIYRLIDRLVQDYGLPPTDQDGRRVQYGLYADHTRRLSREMSLRQAGYDQGGNLYLANVEAPWWEQTPALTRRLSHQSETKQDNRLRLYALLGGVFVVLTIGIVATLILVSVRRSPQVAQQPTLTVKSDMLVERSPTSTLAPLPMSVATAATATDGLPATATLAPLPTAAATAALAPPSTLTVAALPTTTASPAQPFAVFPTATLVNLDADAVTVVGVKREYLDRGERLFFQGRTSFGAYVWNEPELRTRLPASQGNVVISNGDRVAILNQANDTVQVRILTNALDPADPKVIGATGYLPRWLVFDEGVPPPAPTATPNPGKLFVYKLNEDDQPGCISMRIVRTNASGWSFVVDGTNLRGRFDNAGNARLCGLVADQEVTISVLDRNGRIVPGGRGVPSKGRAIMVGEWRQ
ncbi:EsaB/YukD family protein [Roseiflexus castenholzii]|uniref:EsaB/YukD family protein n=1 Tax=Roseiflexus castenholzii TaxID=120962 RepID=UPI003C7C1595